MGGTDLSPLAEIGCWCVAVMSIQDVRATSLFSRKSDRHPGMKICPTIEESLPLSGNPGKLAVEAWWRGRNTGVYPAEPRNGIMNRPLRPALYEFSFRTDHQSIFRSRPLRGPYFKNYIYFFHNRTKSSRGTGFGPEEVECFSRESETFLFFFSFPPPQGPAPASPYVEFSNPSSSPLAPTTKESLSGCYGGMNS